MREVTIMKKIISGFVVAAALSALAPVIPANALPGFCASHEEYTSKHTKGDMYITACSVGSGGYTPPEAPAPTKTPCPHKDA